MDLSFDSISFIYMMIIDLQSSVANKFENEFHGLFLMLTLFSGLFFFSSFIRMCTERNANILLNKKIPKKSSFHLGRFSGSNCKS